MNHAKILGFIVRELMKVRMKNWPRNERGQWERREA